MDSVVVVVVQPGLQGLGSFGFVAACPGVGPFLDHRAVEAFAFAVGLGPVEASVLVFDASS